MGQKVLNSGQKRMFRATTKIWAITLYFQNGFIKDLLNRKDLKPKPVDTAVKDSLEISCKKFNARMPGNRLTVNDS